jgi:hypothetical protein
MLLVVVEQKWWLGEEIFGTEQMYNNRTSLLPAPLHLRGRTLVLFVFYSVPLLAIL